MKRILIIEDDRGIAELERDYLNVYGFEVKNEYTGEAGLAEALSGQYDLILLDIMLPGMDGFEICRRVRESKDMPVLLVSAKRELTDKIIGLGFGADDYIEKPFNFEEMVARVKSHIARYERLTSSGQSNTRQKSICVDDLEIFVDERRILKGGREVYLKNREFDLIVFLAQNANIVFSKDTIFERVWGLDAVGETTTVTVHINRIREKIEDDPANPRFIETMWGAGYRFKM